MALILLLQVSRGGEGQEREGWEGEGGSRPCAHENRLDNVPGFC